MFIKSDRSTDYFSEWVRINILTANFDCPGYSVAVAACKGQTSWKFRLLGQSSVLRGPWTCWNFKAWSSNILNHSSVLLWKESKTGMRLTEASAEDGFDNNTTGVRAAKLRRQNVEPLSCSSKEKRLSFLSPCFNMMQSILKWCHWRRKKVLAIVVVVELQTMRQMMPTTLIRTYDLMEQRTATSPL